MEVILYENGTLKEDIATLRKAIANYIHKEQIQEPLSMYPNYKPLYYDFSKMKKVLRDIPK